MSLHYILDGYNILKQIPAFNDLPLEDGRRALIRWIETARPQGSANNALTVVFDGNPDFFGATPGGATRVIFSNGSADDKIKLMVEEDADPRQCVVVSDDKDIVLYARALGSKVMSVVVFTKAMREPGSLSKSKSHARGGHDGEGKYISLSRQEKINKELSGIWLKEKE